MHWVTLGLLVVLAGLTLALRDPTFIKRKPTVVNWLFAVAFLLLAAVHEAQPAPHDHGRGQYARRRLAAAQYQPGSRSLPRWGSEPLYRLLTPPPKRSGSTSAVRFS